MLFATGGNYMKLPEFQKITQDKTTTPPWAHLMEKGQFISYGPTFQSKIYFDLFDTFTKSTYNSELHSCPHIPPNKSSI